MTSSSGFPKWSLDVRGNVDKDDNDDEHFKGADSTTQSFARENTQNINDVRLKGSSLPAKIRVFVSGPERALPLAISGKYFGGFDRHINASLSKSRLKPEVLTQDCQFLVIEDFNTTGLTGDAHKRHESQGSGNHFYGFFRSAGKSAKTSGGGSWGVGKIVNNMASSVGAFFGYSVRHSAAGEEDLNPRVLMGRATLTTHELDGVNYSPDAFFALREGEEFNSFPTPIVDEQLLDEFVQDWQLQRSPKETGLSIVVPYCEDNVDIKSLPFYLVAETYGFIIAGLQTLEIDLPGFHSIVNEETIEEFCESMIRSNDDQEWASLLERIRLVKLAKKIELAGSEIVLPQLEDVNSAGDYVRGLSKDLTSQINREFLEKGQLLIVVPVRIKETPAGQTPSIHDGLIKVIIGSYPDENDAFYPEYFRDWLRIGVGLRKRSRGERPMGRKTSQVRTIVNVEGGQSNGLAMLLRASEGIAHAKWDSGTKGFKNRWANGENWINFSKNLPLELADLARGLTSERDYSVFPFLADTGDQRSIKNPPPTPPPPPPPPPPPTPGIRIEKINGGFSIGVPKEFTPSGFELIAAYDVTQGNPISSWAPADFKFENLDIEIEGGTVVSRSGNVLVIDVSDPKALNVRVTGFDPNRDLVVKATPGVENEVD
jgi:hypothetical protein